MNPEYNVTNSSTKIWFKIILLIGSLILLSVGFIIGYFSGDRGCNFSPLSFGIKQVNEVNNDNFQCSCNSNFSFKSFTFNSEEIEFSWIK